MDPEPKILKPVILLTTVVVVLSSVGAFFVFQSIQSTTGSPDVVRLDTVPLRAVLDPASLSEERRLALTAAMDRAVLSRPEAPASPDVLAAESSIAAMGLDAVPRLLTALHALSTVPDPSAPTVRSRVLAADTLLRRIRSSLPSPGSDVPPAPPAPDPWPPWARAWLSWWETARTQ